MKKTSIKRLDKALELLEHLHELHSKINHEPQSRILVISSLNRQLSEQEAYVEELILEYGFELREILSEAGFDNEVTTETVKDAVNILILG